LHPKDKFTTDVNVTSYISSVNICMIYSAPEKGSDFEDNFCHVF